MSPDSINPVSGLLVLIAWERRRGFPTSHLQHSHQSALYPLDPVIIQTINCPLLKLACVSDEIL